MEKIPYRPHDTKRFHISDDEFSRERIRAVHELYKELRERYPEIRLAVTVSGSLSKGKVLTEATAPYSDIDMVVYVDEDDAAKYITTHPEVISEKQIHADIQNLVSERLIALRASDPKKMQEFAVNPIRMEGQNSILWNTERFPMQLGPNFSLDVGGGMRPYIQKFLHDIGAMPKDERDRIFKKFMTNSMAWEMTDRVMTKELTQQYPFNYDYALKRYGLKK